MPDANTKTKGTNGVSQLRETTKRAGRREIAMKVLKSTLITLLLTATQVMAYGEAGNGAGPSLLMICFMGFGAMVIVFQVFPAVMLFCGMVKGLVSSTGKRTTEGAAGNSHKV
jgi:hypothetical protein